jgi:demethylmenaquinone methyltransferase/2-methoxy-6-polyprenyl-1,4-benzoquinol methylase
MNPSIKPVPRTKTQARESYNKMSGWYDAISGNTEKKYRDLGLNLLAAQPGERILEIGFGTGHALVTLAQAVGPQGHVTGIDLSDGMADITRQRLAEANLSERVTLLRGDAATHPFEPDTFDAAFMSFTLELFDTPEIPHVLGACLRLLRSGGRLGVVTLVKGTLPGWPVRLYEWFHDRLPTMVDCRPIFGRAALQEAGFTLEKVDTEMMWGLPVEILLGRK